MQKYSKIVNCSFKKAWLVSHQWQVPNLENLMLQFLDLDLQIWQIKQKMDSEMEAVLILKLVWGISVVAGYYSVKKKLFQFFWEKIDYEKVERYSK